MPALPQMRVAILALLACFVVAADPTISTITPDIGTSATDFITAQAPRTVSGTVDARSVVTLTITAHTGGLAQTVVTTGTGFGTWAANVSGLVWTSGTYDLSVSAVDVLGNPNQAPATKILVLDKTPPVPPAITTMDVDSATIGDRITNDNSLIINGISEAAARVEISIDGTVAGIVNSSGSGTWTFTAPVLADGLHHFTAIAIDVAGNRSLVGNDLLVTIDTATTEPALLEITADSGIEADLRTANHTLVLIGAAEVGATVTIGIDGQTRTVVADASGTWAADFTAHNLPDATYQATIGVVDVAGNSASRVASLTIDSTAPSAPTITSIDADTGASATDFITTDNTLVLHGLAEAGATVDVFVDGLPIARTTADAGGAWVADLRSITFPNGTYQMSAQATDAAGNASLPSVQPVVIDNATPPQIRIVALLDDTGIPGDHRTADDRIILVGYSHQLSGITLLKDDVAITPATAGANGSFVCDLTGISLADGTYRFVARGTDANGNQVSSAPFNVIVARAKPDPPELIAIRLDSGIEGDWVTNDNTLEISGTAEPSSVVRVMVDDRLLGLAICGSSGQWVCDLTRWELPEGLRRVTATATNAGGQTGKPSLPRELLIDQTAPPSPTMILASDTGILGDEVTNASPVRVSGNGSPGLDVTVMVNGSTAVTATVLPTGTWRAILPGLSSDGHYLLTAVQVDRADNASFPPVELEVVVDRSITQPVLTALATDSGLPNDRITNDTTPTLTGAADPHTRVHIAVDGVLMATVDADAGGVWSMPTSASWADGTYQVTLSGDDLAGNVVGPGFAVAMTIDTTPPAAPVITAISDDTGASNSDFITSDQTLALHGTAEPGTAVQVAVAGLQVSVVPVAANGTWSFDAQGTVLPGGTYAISAHEIDIAGNVGPDATQEVVIEAIATDDVTILAASPDSGVLGDHITNAEPVALTGLAKPGSTVTVRHAGAESLGTAVTGIDGTWTLSLVALSEGQHNFEASSVDVAGNPGGPSAVFPLVIDRILPVTPTIALNPDTGDSASDGLTNATLVGVGGTGEASAILTVTVNGAAAATLTVPGTGSWFTTLPSLTSDGLYHLGAIQVDAAGNASLPAALDAVVDRRLTQPVLLSLSPDSGAPGDWITNVTSPTLTGTADPLTRVLISVNGGTPTTVTATDSGVWTMATTLLAGSYTVRLGGEDAAGNTIGAGPAVTVTIVTALPAMPQITSISDDTGTLNDDFVTTDQTLVIHGKADVGTTVQVAIAARKLAEVPVDGSGNWSFDAQGTVLPGGTYAISAHAIDVAGNVGPDATQNVVIDLTSSFDVTILAVSPDSGILGDHITNADPVALTGLAEPLSTVTVVNQADGATLGTTATNASGVWILSPLSLPEGAYDIEASSLDLAGNPSATSAVFPLVIDRTAPVVPTIALEPDTGDSASDHLTNATPVGVGGGGEAGASLTILINGSAVTTITVPATGTWHTTLPGMTTDGLYHLSAVQFDVADNASSVTPTLDVMVDRSLSQPVLMSLTTDSGLPGDRITSDTTPTLSGTADPLTRVLVTLDGGVPTTVTADAGGVWTTTTTALANGTHQVTLRGADAAGNAVGPGVAVAVIIDATPPAAPLITTITDDTGASDSDFITSDQSLVLYGTAEPRTVLTVAVAGVPFEGFVVEVDGTWIFDLRDIALPHGVYAITAHATDIAGNEGPDASRDLVIDITAHEVTILGVSPDSGVLGDHLTNADPVALTGLAEPSSTVTVRYAGGSPLGTAVTDAGGAWTLSLPSLSNGAFNFTASSVDLAGNSSGTSAVFPLEIDRIAPVAPTIALDPDTGDSDSDGLTNADPVGVGGSGEPGAILTVSVDGSVAATLTVPSSGPEMGLWFTTLPGMTTDGFYLVVAVQVDAAGNASPLAVLNAVVDHRLTQPLLTSLATDSGASADWITNDATPTLSGTADPLTRVVVVVDDVDLTTVQASAGGVWTLPTTLADGIYQVTLRGEDAAGNTKGPVTAVAVTIDTTPPLAPVITSISDDTGTSSTDFITRDQTLVIHGKAEPGTTVQMAVAARQLAMVPVDSNGDWSFDAQGTVLPGGTYAVTAHAIDVAGNVGPDATRNVVIDLTSTYDVAILAVSPDSGVLGDHLTNGNPVALTGLAEPASTVTVINQGDGTTLGTAPTNASGVWTLSAVVLPDGAYNFVASSVDLAGNPGGPSAAFPLRIDHTAPVAPTITLNPDTGDSAVDHLTNASPVGVGGSGEVGATLTVTINGTVAATLTVPATGLWHATLPSLTTDGQSSLVATQMDVAGNASPASPTLTATVDRSLTQPVLTSLSTDSGLPSDRITNDATPTLTGTADPLTRVVIVIDGVDLTTVQATAGGVWTTTANALVDGTHQVTLRGEDAAGNVIGPGAAVAVTIDATPPLAPVITAISDDTGAFSTDFITTDQTLVIHGTAEPGTTVQVAIAAKQLVLVPVAPNGTWSFDAQGTVLPGGTYPISVHAIDVAGNVGPTTTRNVVIDITSIDDVTILAASPDTGVLGDHITKADPVELAGLAEPASTVTVINQAGGASMGTAVTDAGGVWALSLLSLPNGAYDFSATSVDLAGNSDGPSAAFHLVIDRTAPVAPTIVLNPDTGDSASDGLTKANPVGVGGSGEPGASLTISVDGSVATMLTVPGNGTWSATLPGMTTDGHYLLVAVQMDVAGNASPLAVLNAVVDRSLTQPLLTSLATDSGLSGDWITNDATPTLSGTADPLTRVVVVVDDVDLTTVQATTGGVWATTATTAWVNGTHQVKLRGADAAGNAKDLGTLVTVTIDTTPPLAPVITSITTDTGASSTDFITKDQTLVVRGTAEAGTTVQVAIAAKQLAAVVVDGNGSWSFDVQGTVLPGGTYAVTAHAIDVAGNVGPDATRNVVIDLTSTYDVTILAVSPDSGVLGDHLTNGSPVALTGLAEPASTVTVVKQAGGATMGTAVTNAGGVWTLSAIALTDGAYDFVASSVDLAGNPGGTSAPFHLVIDRTAPVVPTIALNPDTGDSASDHLTNADPVGVGGSGEVGATLTVTINGTVAATLTVPATGLWHATLPSLTTDGQSSLVAKQVDAAGNASPTTPTLTAVVDRSLTLPVLTSLATDSGVPGDWITSDANATLTGTADPLTRVVIMVDGVELTTVQASAGGVWTTTANDLPDETYLVTLRGEDAAGNTKVPVTAVAVTIDTTPPLAPVITSISDDTGASSTDFITTDQTLVISGTAEVGAEVALAVAGQPVAVVPADGTGNWSFDAQGTVLPEGVYVISAHAIDVAGNVGPVATQEVTIDLTSSDVAILEVSPDSGVVGDHITNGTSVSLTGLAEPFAVVTVVNQAGGAPLGPVLTDLSGVWTLSLGSLSEGAYDYVASSVDVAGNSGGPSAAFHIVIDRTEPLAPTIALNPDTGDVGNDGLTNADPVGVGGTGEPGASLNLTINGEIVATLTIPATGPETGIWHTTLLSLTTDGLYHLTAAQKDAAGNVSTPAALDAVVDRRPLATGAPVIVARQWRDW